MDVDRTIRLVIAIFELTSRQTSMKIRYLYPLMASIAFGFSFFNSNRAFTISRYRALFSSSAGIFDQRIVFGKSVYIMREDLLNVSGLSGNKARKLYYLAQLDPFPRNIVSYGGVQSNSMEAISCLAYQRRGTFYYFTKKVPKFLKANPIGNYKLAVANGMKVNIFPRLK